MQCNIFVCFSYLCYTILKKAIIRSGAKEGLKLNEILEIFGVFLHNKQFKIMSSIVLRKKWLFKPNKYTRHTYVWKIWDDEYTRHP